MALAFDLKNVCVSEPVGLMHVIEQERSAVPDNAALYASGQTDFLTICFPGAAVLSTQRRSCIVDWPRSIWTIQRALDTIATSLLALRAPRQKLPYCSATTFLACN